MGDKRSVQIALRIAAVALSLAALAPQAQGMLRRGDLVISQPGGLVRVDPATGVAIRLHVTPSLAWPADMLVLPDGRLLVADFANPEPDAGSVVRVDPWKRTATRITAPGSLENPMGLARSPDGRVILADVDAGSHLVLANGTVLRRGSLFDLDPGTGGLSAVVPDCGWNPVAIVFAGPNEILAADPGCCAFSGPGALLRVDLATGTSVPMPTAAVWRDPFGLALSSDGATLWITESAAAEPGPPAVLGVDTATGVVTVALAGLPLVEPIGLLLESDGRLLVADQGAHAVLRVDPVDGTAETLVQGAPLDQPGRLTRYDLGDTVAGRHPSTASAAACAQVASRHGSDLAARVLRCVATRTGTEIGACSDRAAARYVGRTLSPGCPNCVNWNHYWLAEELPEALTRTPGAGMACAGVQSRCRTRLAKALARLYRDLGRCDAAAVSASAPDASALETCRSAAAATYLSSVTRLSGCGSCSPAQLDAMSAQIASLVDGVNGAWFCEP